MRSDKTEKFLWDTNKQVYRKLKRQDVPSPASVRNTITQ